MDDVFQHAMLQIHKEAAPEMVAGFKEKMEYIKRRYKHSEKTVKSCLDGISKNPTLLELLTAAFVVNGGVLFKHGAEIEEEEGDEKDFNDLMREIARLETGEPESPISHDVSEGDLE